MATLQQIRAQIYAKIRETSGSDSHFTDSQINGFINESQEFATVFIEYPRDLVSVQVQSNVGDYTLPSDTLIVRTAYFGDVNTAGNIGKLEIISEETLKELFPQWLDNTGTDNGRPRYLIVKDRITLSIYPRPSVVESAAGKSVWINYNYVPTQLVQDSDVSVLPLPFHNLLQFYALSLVYMTLQNKDMADYFWKMFMDKVKLLKAAVSKETKEGLFFQWGTQDVDVDIPGQNQGIIFP